MPPKRTERGLSPPDDADGGGGGESSRKGGGRGKSTGKAGRGGGREVPVEASSARGRMSKIADLAGGSGKKKSVKRDDRAAGDATHVPSGSGKKAVKQRTRGKKVVARGSGKQYLEMGKKPAVNAAGYKGLEEFLEHTGLVKVLGHLEKLLGHEGLEELVGNGGLVELLGSGALEELLGHEGLEELLGNGGLEELLAHEGLAELLGDGGLEEEEEETEDGYESPEVKETKKTGKKSRLRKGWADMDDWNDAYDIDPNPAEEPEDKIIALRCFELFESIVNMINHPSRRQKLRDMDEIILPSNPSPLDLIWYGLESRKIYLKVCPFAIPVMINGEEKVFPVTPATPKKEEDTTFHFVTWKRADGSRVKFVVEHYSNYLRAFKIILKGEKQRLKPWIILGKDNTLPRRFSPVVNIDYGTGYGTVEDVVIHKEIIADIFEFLLTFNVEKPETVERTDEGLVFFWTTFIVLCEFLRISVVKYLVLEGLTRERNNPLKLPVGFPGLLRDWKVIGKLIFALYLAILEAYMLADLPVDERAGSPFNESMPDARKLWRERQVVQQAIVFFSEDLTIPEEERVMHLEWLCGSHILLMRYDSDLCGKVLMRYIGYKGYWLESIQGACDRKKEGLEIREEYEEDTESKSANSETPCTSRAISLAEHAREHDLIMARFAEMERLEKEAGNTSLAPSARSSIINSEAQALLKKAVSLKDKNGHILSSLRPLLPHDPKDSAEVSPSEFEAHGGERSKSKQYDNMFTSNGASLHELPMKISKDMESSERETDDLCRECGQGGDIFPCKMCPRSFHLACVGLSEVPSEWFCDNCCILGQKEKALTANKNSKAAGMETRVDSVEEIMKRAIRIVPISDDLGQCVLCKKKDFNNAVFDERTVILCDQCEKKYHVGCLRSQWQVDLKELPGEWFCCNRCSDMRSSLDNIISNGAQPLSESDIDIIRKKHESKGLVMDTNTDIRWQLLAGRSASEDGNLLLSSAIPVIHQSFDPIVEAHTGRDLIPEMVNGKRRKDGMPGQDYSGMYCAVLTVGPTVVSAALLRVIGGDVAELPLAASSMDFQGLGYFQVLFSCMENMLISLKIKHFMLPAAHEAEAIWTKKFGFSRIPHEELEAYLNGAHLTVFNGTSNLYKAVPMS